MELTWGEETSHVWNSEACDEVVVGCQEVLAVWVIQITGHDGASSDADVLFCIRMEEDRVVNLTAEADSMV